MASQSPYYEFTFEFPSESETESVLPRNNGPIWLRVACVRNATSGSYNAVSERIEHVKEHFDEEARAPHLTLLNTVSNVFRQMLLDIDSMQRIGYEADRPFLIEEFKRLSNPYYDKCQYILVIKLFHYYVHNLKTPDILLFPVERDEVRETFRIITDCFDNIDSEFSKCFHL